MANQERELQLDVEIEEIQERGKNLLQKVAGTVRTGLMVGIGSLDLAQEKVVKLWDNSNDMVKELAERGENASAKRREQITEEVDKRQEQVKDLEKKASESFDKYSEAVLTRVNIPTTEDIHDLSKQVSALSRKVDKVRKEQQEALTETA